MANNEKDTRLAREVIVAFRNLGGTATRNEIRREIRDNSKVISEEEVDEEKRSRNGNLYSPFYWPSNFMISYLAFADYLVKGSKRGEFELTKKGRTCDLASLNYERDVKPLAEANRDNQGRRPADDPSEDDQPTGDADVEEQWRVDLLKSLEKMDPQKFELFCRGLLNKMGVEIDDTLGIQYVGDGGIDGFGYVRSDDFRTTRVALQAKRWQGKVSAPEIDKFRGAMDKFNAESGIFITNSDFTREAVKAARQGTRIITLINGSQLCDLVAKYQFYVEPVVTYKLKDFYLEDN